MSKLFATLETSKGKTVSISDNDRIEISIILRNRVIADICALPSGTIMIDGNDGAEIIVNR